jgi:nitroreductase
MFMNPKHAQTNYPILPSIAERYSPYAFDPRPVEREKLLSCLEAARWSASSYNEQPWSYLLAERTDEEEFSRALGCLTEANQAWAKNAGVLILTVTTRLFAKNNKPNRVCELDIGLASCSLSIQATALGLAVHQMAGIEPAKIRLTYGVPEFHDPMTAIAIGYAARVEFGTSDPLAQRDLTPRTRKLFDEYIYTGAWGQPAKLT